MTDDDVSWLQSLLESRRPDPGPVVGRWALGIGDMVADHPLTPDKLRGLARKLNYFGGVAISEEGVEFDGDRRQVVGHHRDSHAQPHRVSVHRRYRQAGRQAAAALVPLPQEGDQRDLAGGADAVACGRQATARRRRAGNPDTRRGGLPRHAAHPRTVAGHARRGGLGRPCGSSVFRVDGSSARHRPSAPPRTT